MDVRGLTLRSKSTRKRPQISAPRPIEDPNAQQIPKQPEQTTAPPAARIPAVKAQQDGGQTSDLVKRRYSTRFNQLPNFNADAPPVPSLPGGHSEFSSASIPSSRDASGAATPLKVDLKALRDPKLPVESCTWDILRGKMPC